MMKKDVMKMSPIDPCQSPLAMPTFVLGRRYFAPSHPGCESHLHISRVDDYHLVYRLLGSRRWLSPASLSSSLRKLHMPPCQEEPQLHRLLLSILGPEGRAERSPQVVFTLIGTDGIHRMTQGHPCSEGHSLIFEWDDPRGLRIETEVVANGRFITDHFILDTANRLN